MKVAPRNSSSKQKDAAVAGDAVKVCMHVLGRVRTDVRAMRAASTLVEAGFTVSIIDVEDEHTPPIEDMNGTCVQHIIVPETFFATRFRRWAIFRAGWMLIRGILRLLQTPADIYHALDLPALPACYVAAQLRRKPLIFESYELPLSLPLFELSTSRRWLYALLRPLLAIMIPRCDKVIAVSPPIVEEMCRRYHVTNVSLIRNVPPYQIVPESDRLRHFLGLNANIRIALYQGYLQPGRGLDIVIRAAAFLERDIVIVLMGKNIGTTQEQLEALVAAEGVADRVKIIPAVPYTELLNWTASADIGLTILPPDYSPNIQMILPNKFFEYLMAGIPVLTSQLDTIVEIVKSYDVGRVVHSLEPSEVGAAINAVLADAAALIRMRYNALHAARHTFCWEIESSELIQLYREIQSKNQRR